MRLRSLYIKLDSCKETISEQEKKIDSLNKEILEYKSRESHHLSEISEYKERGLNLEAKLNAKEQELQK